jgi:O-antigen/teichoic acid export membrane protein
MTGAAELMGMAARARGIRGRLLRGSGIYLLTSAVLRLIGFAVLTIYSRYLTPRDFGIVSIAESASLAVGIIAGLGLESGCRRLYFQYAANPEELRSYLATVFRLGAAAGALVLLLAYLAGPWIVSRIVPASPLHFFPYLALPILTAIASQLLSCLLVVFQCQERHFAYSGFVALQSLSTTLFTLALVVWSHHGAAGLLCARALGACLALSAAAVVSSPLLRARTKRIYIQETLRISIPLVFHALMAAGLVVIDRFILQHDRPLSDVGLYSLAYSFGMTMTLVTGSVYRSWAPLFFALHQKGEEGRTSAGRVGGDLLLLMSLVACAGSLLAPLCVHWLFDSRYWPAAGLVPILICAYLCHSGFAFFQLALIQARRSVLVTAVSGAALAANVALNLAWIPRFGIAGAAFATLAAYGLEVGLAAILAQRVNRLEYGWLRPLLAVLVGALGLASWRFQLSAVSSLIALGLLSMGCAAAAFPVFRARRRKQERR